MKKHLQNKLNLFLNSMIKMEVYLIVRTVYLM